MGVKKFIWGSKKIIWGYKSLFGGRRRLKLGVNVWGYKLVFLGVPINATRSLTSEYQYQSSKIKFLRSKNKNLNKCLVIHSDTKNVSPEYAIKIF